MNLIDYLNALNDDAKAARLFGMKKVRTVKSWRLGERVPARRQAAMIVKRSPVTYEGIYSPKAKS